MQKEISASLVEEAVFKLVLDSCYSLDNKVYSALEHALDSETSELGRNTLIQILKNADIAAEEKIPLCQDTGFAVVFVDIGQDVHIIGGSFKEAINKGVSKGYIAGFLRKSMVTDPLFDRKNTEDNTPAIIHMNLVPGSGIKIKFAAKGTGSENKSALKMLSPADGIEGIKQFVIDTVKNAGASACPPLVVGIGIGGNMELVALYAKKAALRDVDTYNNDSRYAALERELLGELNNLGIGPLGFGGNTTVLKVNIDFYPTHISLLPVAVNINCHSVRHSEVIL